MNWLQRIWQLIFGPPPAPAPPPVPTPDTGTPASRQTLALVNDARAGDGLPPYQWSEPLATEAGRWAAQMSRRGLISHVGIVYRLATAGYTTGGECVAEGQPTAAEVVASWLNSPGHRAILLEPRYTDAGVGAAKGEDGRIYWCLLAGRREGNA